ncbi:MAG: hypothetical protein E7G42_01400 [Serratia marcescens]|uniref:hypothetical protein n=1 Tax=Pantoea eucrina TaxID=472693 RepID=UPI0028B1BB87|nr:hypothetical protein [Serratia marcescens]MDU3817740.1 hypothetical protein [Pantoea sp.]
MDAAEKPIRKGSRVRIRGNLFNGEVCVVDRVDWLENGQRYVLKHPYYTCPLNYTRGDLELIPDDE